MFLVHIGYSLQWKFNRSSSWHLGEWFSLGKKKKTHKENQKLNNCKPEWQCYNIGNRGIKRETRSIVLEESSNIFPSILKDPSIPNVYFLHKIAVTFFFFLKRHRHLWPSLENSPNRSSRFHSGFKTAHSTVQKSQVSLYWDLFIY